MCRFEDRERPPRDREPRDRDYSRRADEHRPAFREDRGPRDARSSRDDRPSGRESGRGPPRHESRDWKTERGNQILAFLILLIINTMLVLFAVD